MEQEKAKRLLKPRSVEVHYPEQMNINYSNRVQLFVSNSDIIFDFFMTEPASTAKTPKAIFQTRVIMSPQHAKQFSRILGENIGKYEEMFGPISTAPIKK